MPAITAERQATGRAHTVGRRRNRPLAAWRQARAVELATAGLSYDSIARQVGYTNRGSAYRAVRGALEKQTSQAAQALLSQELDRLNALQAAVWDRAMAGEIGAVLAVHKIVLTRCKLLGLDKPERPPAKFQASVVLTPEELARRAGPRSFGPNDV